MSSQLLVIYSKWHNKTLILVPSSSALHVEVVLSQTILYLSVLLTPFFSSSMWGLYFQSSFKCQPTSLCNCLPLHCSCIQFCQECQSNCLDKGVRLAIPGPWAVREGKIIPCQNFFFEEHIQQHSTAHTRMLYVHRLCMPMFMGLLLCSNTYINLINLLWHLYTVLWFTL